MIEKTCCFTGHRNLGKNIKTIKYNLKKEIVNLIKKDVTYFGAGGALGFDTLVPKLLLN